jgi:hypothetical protein
MKSSRSLTLSTLIAALAVMLPASLSAQIINIDFLSQRNAGGNTETVASNYVGQGAAGGGTFFNGILALNDLPLNNPSDNITVTGTDFVDSNDVATTVGFSMSGVGADHSGDTGVGILNGAYLFLNSDGSNNHSTSAPFTITGLGSTATATLYFYTGLSAPTLTFTNGGTSTPFTETAIAPFTSSNTYEFTDVPVVDGEITGTFGSPNIIVLGGLTIVETPEPTTWAMLFGGLALLAGIQRFRRIA